MSDDASRSAEAETAASSSNSDGGDDEDSCSVNSWEFDEDD
jgi:hypothetical protein